MYKPNRPAKQTNSLVSKLQPVDIYIVKTSESEKGLIFNNTIQYNTMQYNTRQYNTTQYNEINNTIKMQNDVIQHNTM